MNFQFKQRSHLDPWQQASVSSIAALDDSQAELKQNLQSAFYPSCPIYLSGTNRVIHVLLVEDNPGDVRLVKEMLLGQTGMVFELVHKQSLSQACQYLQEVPPDLILLDLSLPDAQGLDTLRGIGRVNSKVPVIILTGVSDTDIALEALKDGAQDYLIKGEMNRGLLIRAISYAIERQYAQTVLNNRMRQQAAVAELGQLAAANISLPTLEHISVTLVTSTLEVDFCELLELTADQQILKLRAGLGWPQQRDQLLPLSLSENDYLRCVLNRQDAIVLKELWQETQFAKAQTLLNYGVSSGVLVPLMGQQHPIGALNVYTGCPRNFSQDEVYFLQAIANILATAMQQLQAEETMRLLESAIQQTTDCVTITDANLDFPGPEIVYVNPAFTRMTGYSFDEAVGQTPRMLQGPKTDRLMMARLKQTLRQGQMFYGETVNYRKDGSEFNIEWHIAPIKNATGEVTHYVAIQRDITQRKQFEAELAQQAFYDVLTQLPNRALFMDRLHRASERAKRRENYLYAVLFLDLDRFKVINDSLGHAVGDQFLRAIGDRIHACLRAGDTIARLGGDEFAILLDDLEDGSQATLVATRILQELTTPFTLLEHQVFSSASIGITLSSSHYIQLEEMLRDADIAMYRAKMQGKACYQVFDTTMHTQAVQRLHLENDLRRAIEQQQLCLHYQPIVCLASGRLTGFESLVRWQHPQRGMISPGDFISIAEETGLILPLGEWVLRAACEQIRQWEISYPLYQPFSVSVNLSVKQFTQPNLVQMVGQVISETGIDPQHLKLEITESVLIENLQKTAWLLQELIDLGVQLSLDDFGTGFSSLSDLHHLPIDILKIDRSFVSNMETGNKNLEIVRTIINLAENLNMQVVAEGVETLQQMLQLQDLGCTYGQGYFFSRPLSREAANVLLQTDSPAFCPIQPLKPCL